MNRPAPQATIDLFRREVIEFFSHISRCDQYDKVEYERLVDECARLQREDVVSASLLRAMLASGIADDSEFERWVRNAEANGAHDRAGIERFKHAVNHGHASKALAMCAEAVRRRAGVNLMDLARGMFSIGGFKTIVSAVEQSQANQEVLNMTTLLDRARNASTVADQLGVTDADIAAMLDVAGDMLRSRRLFWQGEHTDVMVLLADQGGPALTIEYRLGVTPVEAARMSWDLAEKLVDRDLDKLGVTLGFLGEALA